MSSNWDKIRARLAKTGIGVPASGAEELASRLWSSIASWIDAGNLSWDNDTYNLRDSIACGVYQDGMLVKLFTMEPAKGTPKTYTYHKMRMSADGTRLVKSVFLQRPYTEPGTHIVFRCPLNYGFFLEYGLGPDKMGSGNPAKKGYGWWSNELVPQIEKEFRRIANELKNNQ